MQRRFLFLLNPRAGVQSGKPLSHIIEEQCRAAQQPFEIVNTVADGNYDFLIEPIEKAQITDVIICGGDGTISAAVSSLRHLPVQFGILPRGSGNGLAFAAGIPKSTRKALELIFRNKAQPVDAFLINGTFSCMLSGLGFDAAVAHAFDKQTKRGLWKYVQLTLQQLKQLNSYPFVLETNGQRIETNALFLSIANSNQFGNHFTIAPRASLQDGLLDIVAVEQAVKPLLLLRLLWHLRFGTFTKNLQHRHGILYLQTKQIRIHNPQQAPLHIDGDGKPTATQFDIEVIPAAYRLLLP